MPRKPRFHGQYGDVEHIKFYICQVIDREIMRRQLTYQEFARMVGTTPACISYVVNKKTKKVTFNQLFRYLQVLKPNFGILIST